MRQQFTLLAAAVLAAAAWIFAETPAGSAQAKRVVVSVKPIHSLVAAIMQGVGSPELLVPGAPPTALPADAAAKLAEADLVFWIGPSLEKFMEPAVLLRRQGVVAIALLDAPGVRLMALPNNTPSAVVVAPKPVAQPAAKPAAKPADEKPPVAKVEPPKKPNTDDDSYNPEADKKPVPSDKVEATAPPGQRQTAESVPERKTLVVPPVADKPVKSPDDEPDADDTGDTDAAKPGVPADPRTVGPRLDPGTHLTRKRPDLKKEVKKEDLQVGNPDPQIWLDPRNAVALARAIAGTLSQIDPPNARLYQRNAAALIANIESTEAEITGLVGEVDTRPFASVNQSFQYFEANFVMRPRSRINFASLSPPAERINDARDRLRREEVACVFYPAGFDPRAATGLVNGIATRAAAIDAFGVGVEPGPDAYHAIMRKIAETYVVCLAARRR